MKIIRAETFDDDRTIAALADRIWHEHFATLLSQDQIDYMLAKFLSADAIRDAIERDGYEYGIVREEDGTPIGFYGVRQTGSVLFLSKLYLLKKARGRGYATQTLRALVEKFRPSGIETVRLTCNKYNASTLEIYRHWGFERVESVVTEIGAGYVMDDYILELRLADFRSRARGCGG